MTMTSFERLALSAQMQLPGNLLAMGACALVALQANGVLVSIIT